MRKHPWIILVLAIIILVVPTVLYLVWLVPQLTEEYNTLLASAGVIGTVGLYGADKIPEGIKYGSLFKMSSRAYTLLIVLTVVEKFVNKLLILAAIMVACFVIYKILIECWKTARRLKENGLLAKQIARGIDKTA